MSGKPPVNDDDLYMIAKYLSRPSVDTEIWVHVATHLEKEFRKEYKKLTGLTVSQSHANFAVYSYWTDSNAMSYRIYYKLLKTEPAEIRNVRTEYGRWHIRPEKYVIHHTSTVSS